MGEAYDYLRRYITEAKDVARPQWKSFAACLFLLSAFYCATLFIPSGIVTYLLVFPAAFVIAVTTLARVNDIGVEHMGVVWHVRRLGLVMTGAAAVMMMGAPFVGDRPMSWWLVLMSWGVAISLITTSEQPPWWPYITGEYRHRPPPLSPLGRVLNWMAKKRRRNDRNES